MQLDAQDKAFIDELRYKGLIEAEAKLEPLIKRNRLHRTPKFVRDMINWIFNKPNNFYNRGG